MIEMGSRGNEVGGGGGWDDIDYRKLIFYYSMQIIFAVKGLEKGCFLF